MKNFVRLSEVCTISASKADIEEEGAWLLNLDKVESKTGRVLEHEVVPREKLNGSIVQFDTGNVLYSKLRPNLNKVVLPEENGYATSEMLPLRPRESKLTRGYLAEYLRSDNFVSWAVGKTAGAKMPRLGTKVLMDKMIPLPPLEEQHKIVSLFSVVNHVISLRQQQLAKLDELVKAWFVEMFICKDNPMVTLDSLTLGKSEYGAQSASAEYDSNRPRYIRITDINDDGTLNNDIVSSANIEDDQRYKLTYGDFLFARMGATVGKTYAYKSGDQIFAGYLIRYKLNLQKIMPEYLFAYTKLEKYKKWVLLNQSGAAQPGINAKKYGSLQIPLAPLEEQRAFTNFVRQTDKSRLLIRKSLEQMETLKKALMQQYFG